MIIKIKNSLKNINYKLFIALLIMGFCPTIYNTLRVFWLGNLPGEYSYSIAGQLSWVNLIYEIINEAIILPLFYFMGKAILDKKDFINKIKTGLIITFSIYLFLSVFVIIFTEPLLKIMAISVDIIDMSIKYIRLEAVANVFYALSSFTLVSLVTIGKDKYVYFCTLFKLVLTVFFDIFMISSLNVSLNLGVNGIAISNIIINLLMFVFIVGILYKNEFNIFNKDKLSFKWIKKSYSICLVSGFESFIRNIFYIVMISRMVNVVGEQGTYWVANNFIWGWLLLPIIQLGVLIKQEVATNKDNVGKNTLGYFIITTTVCLVWFIAIPLYKPFMKYVFNYNDVEKIYNLVILLLGFYVLYSFQNIFDSTFYGLGKTHYMLFESVITNVIYYGICFVLYITNVFTPSLVGITLMFGIGNAFDSIVSYFVYLYMLKKEKIRII